MSFSKELIKYCHEMVSYDTIDWPSDSCPQITDDLASTYDHIFTAQKIGKIYSGIIIGEASLLRGALDANHEDRVRVECLQQLINSKSQYTEITLIALLFDTDPLLRTAALEGLVIICSAQRYMGAELLHNDDCSDVSKLALQILNNENILLYTLDVP